MSITEPQHHMIFSFGERTYYLTTRDRDGLHIAVTIAGDIVGQFSVKHFGHVKALKLAVELLEKIETDSFSHP